MFYLFQPPSANPCKQNHHNQHGNALHLGRPLETKIHVFKARRPRFASAMAKMRKPKRPNILWFEGWDWNPKKSYSREGSGFLGLIIINLGGGFKDSSSLLRVFCCFIFLELGGNKSNLNNILFQRGWSHQWFLFLEQWKRWLDLPPWAPGWLYPRSPELNRLAFPRHPGG